MEKNFGKGEAILEIHVANILSNLAKKKLSDKILSFYDVAHKQRSLCYRIGFLSLCTNCLVSKS